MRVDPQPTPPVLLDGAMGTLLGERGFELRSPLFSARALIEDPERVIELHLEYLRAGAQILTTNSFNLHAGTLAGAGLGERQAELVQRSVALLDEVRGRARADPSMAGSARFRIAGSIPPRPRGATDTTALARAEYGRFAALLADAGADLILLETFTDTREVALALAGIAAHEISLPVWLALAAGAPVPNSRKPDGARSISGEPLEALAELTRADGPGRVPDAILIHCTQLDAIPAALEQLVKHVPEPIALGLSPHLGKRRYDGAWVDRILEPDVLARQIHAWIQARPRLVIAGACCGSRPDEIAALRDELHGDVHERERAFVQLARLLP